MKKIVCVLMVLLLALLPSTVFAQEETMLSDGNRLPLGQYREVFSEEHLSNFLSLDEYREEYSNNQNHLQSPSQPPPITTENAPPSLMQTVSPVKYQTKDINLSVLGTYMGHITLQYQTWILGGRPQFIFDRCFLGHPQLAATIYTLDWSDYDFTGDKITVSFQFSFASSPVFAYVYFYP